MILVIPSTLFQRINNMVPTYRAKDAVFVCVVQATYPVGTEIYSAWNVEKGWNSHTTVAGEVGPAKRFGIGGKTYDIFDNDLEEMEPENPKPGDICTLWFYGKDAKQYGIPVTRG